MILTVTLNPSIDYLYAKDTFTLGAQNRFTAPVRMIGGKGINAGRTATILGSKVFVTGVLGGTNGKIVEKLLSAETFKHHFFPVPGETRNAITIMHDQGIQTEIVEEGPEIDPITERALFDYVITMCQQHPDISVICLSGSANSTNELLYHELIQLISHHFQDRIKVLADISGNQLRNTLASETLPFFIKPNLPEFGELLGIPLHSKAEVFDYLNHPLVKPIPLLLVSCGEDGAVAKYNDCIYDLKVPTIELVNPTGSGDATVGGIAYALDRHFEIEEVLRYGMVSGVANALEEAVGFVQPNIIAKILSQVTISIQS